MSYIVSRRYDWAFFLLPPIPALCLGVVVSGTSFASDVRWLGLERDTLVGFFIGTVIHAHLVAVVFRSHANPAIRRHPVRFLVVPVALWLAIVASPWIAIASTVVATFWDVWHSGAQTFGFARIYERNYGNPPELGRRWDLALNQVLYAGPMLAGATLMEHVRSFDSFADVGDALFASVPAHVEGLRRWLVLGVLAAGSLIVIGYSSRTGGSHGVAGGHLAKGLAGRVHRVGLDLHVGLQLVGPGVLDHEPVPWRAVPRARVGEGGQADRRSVPLAVAARTSRASSRTASACRCSAPISRRSGP